MGPLDAFWHLAGFLAVPLLLAGLASGSAKLLWRGDLAGSAWRTLFGWAAAGTVAPAIAGLLAFGRDGRMLTYLAMVLGCALMLWWRGFGPGRRGSR